MRNKVRNNIAGRITAILLTLVMILGTFSVAAFANEAETQETPQIVEETVKTAEPVQSAPADADAQAGPAVADNAAPAEVPEAAKPAAEEAQPEETAWPAAEEAQPEGSVQPMEEEVQPAVAENAAESDVTEEAVPAAEEAQPAEEAVQPEEAAAEEAVKAEKVTARAAKSAGEATEGAAPAEETAKDAGEYAVSFASGGITASVDGKAVSSGDSVYAGKTIDLYSSEEEGKYQFTVINLDDGSTIELNGGSFTMPEGRVNVIASYLLDLRTDDIPDGVTIKLDVTSGGVTTTQEIRKGDQPFFVAAGAMVIVQSVEGLVSEYQQGNAPGNAAKQLKMVINDGGNEFRVSLNNSDAMKRSAAAYTMPERAVSAIIAIANRIAVTSDTDPYHQGSCSIRNLSDSTSHLADFFALPGDKISVDYDSQFYDSVDIEAYDAAGNKVSASGGQFAMPSSKADLKIRYYHKPRTVAVTNLKPARGTISTKETQYRPGDTVVITVKANSGYKFNTKTLVYTYTKDGKRYVESITKGSDGKYSFVMPFYDVTISGVFVEKATADKASDPGAYIEYSAVEEEETVEATHDEELLNVLPLTSAITAQTVLGITTGLSLLAAS